MPTRRTVPAGSSTSLPSVAAIVPPPPIRMPASAPLAPPRMRADDRADAGAGADPAGFASDALALERFGHRRAHRIGTVADREPVERHRQAARALDAPGLLDRADDAAHDRAGRHDDAVRPASSRRASSLRTGLRPARSPSSAAVCSRTSNSVPTGTSSRRSRPRVVADRDDRSRDAGWPGCAMAAPASPRARVRIVSIRSRRSRYSLRVTRFVSSVA